MKTRLGWKLAVGAILVSLAPLAAAAQNPQSPPGTQPPNPQIQRPQPPQGIQIDQDRPAAQQPQAGSQDSSTIDAQLASCLIVDNQNAVALAQIALQKAQSDAVKKFAQQMIEQHQQAIGSLQQFAGASRGAQIQQGQGNLAAAPGAIGQAGVNVMTALKPDLSSSAGGLNPLSLKQELAAQCLQSARRELDQKQGAEFDQCFMAMQVGAHMMLVDTLQVFQNHASSEFRKTLAKQQQTAQSHLDHAKDIFKSQLASAKAGIR